MVKINIPDPHPGRCKNHRLVGDEMVRCLDYDVLEHACSFPKPQPVPTRTATQVWTWRPQVPTPWVKP